MPEPDPDTSAPRSVDRRTFLKGGLLAGGGVLAGGAAMAALARSGSGPAKVDSPSALPPVALDRAPVRRNARPNILVIVVDQMRSNPRWLASDPVISALLPNLSRLSRGGVSFASHYTASNDCTPARSTLLTGLYTHQTGCMVTGGSTLDPGFPTWGSMLREHAYRTYWYGKWHLTHMDNKWDRASDSHALERYGFSGGTYPSPDGGPGQGWRVDPHIAEQFEGWFADQAGEEPWCTTVSFVNPHDIAWWYGWSDRVPAEANAPRVVERMPLNFETPEQLIARGKPRLQRSLQDTAAASFGPVPFTGPEVSGAWLPFLDLYVKLQREVDHHVGRVLRALESRPEVAANTVVLFTSDHGEYGAAHGLRGKGAGVYEEAIRVPLIVKDPRGLLTSAPAQTREQLTSSVDVAPLLLTIATGSDDWRREPHYAHLADRADIAAILADPAAPGRPYVVHATDEVVTEFAIEPYAADAPRHVLALRTATAKYATYSNWDPETIDPLSGGQDSELYDYRTRSGRLELHNGAGYSSLEDSLRLTLEQAYRRELHQPLPQRFHSAHARGFADYFAVTARASASSQQRRLRHRTAPGTPRWGVPEGGLPRFGDRNT